MYEVDPDLLAVGKALGEETRFAIFRRIASSDTPLTVKDLVAAFGMHHSAIRIHLNKLEEAGLIVSEKRHRHRAVGRPELAFLPSPSAVSISLPPRNYEFLARMAVDYAAAQKDPERSLEAFGLEWGRAYIAEHSPPADGPMPLGDALAALRDTLGTLGAGPTIEAMAGDGYEVYQRNCLFGELARDHNPTVCSLHQAVMRGMLEAFHGDCFVWEQVSSLARGDDRCHIHVAEVGA